jgi:hypothetical protein
MPDRDQALPNPFAELPAPPDPELADVVAAIERELRAFIDRPPRADEFTERIPE